MDQRGGCMKFFGTVPFLVLMTFSGSLFAQSAGGTASTGSGSTGLADTTVQVENQSELGGFIGSGRPTAFVGIDEIYSTSSSTRRTSSSSAARVTTTTRPRTVTSAAQRQLGTTRTSSALGNTSAQTIQSITSLDVDLMVPHVRRPLTTTEAQLSRIRGIRDSQIFFTDSPIGTTAVLTGTVASERARRVAQQFLLMEPGINRVENLLQVR